MLLLVPLPGAAACEQAYEMPVALLGYVTYRNTEGALAGYAIEQMQALAHRSGCSITAVEYPAERMRMMARKGLVAMMAFTGEPPPQAGRYWVRSLPPENRMHLLVRASLVTGQASVEAVLNRPDIMVGVVRGLNYGPQIDALLASLPAARRDVSATLEDLARKFAAGRIQATVGFPIVYLHWVDRYRLRGAVVSIPIPGATDPGGGWSFWSPPIAPADLPRLKAAAEAMEADGTNARLMARYLHGRAAPHTPPPAPPAR